MSKGPKEVKRCTGCKIATYCLKKCTHGDWRDKSGGHQEECKRLQMERPDIT
ncbi:SET and MYND domain-containing protein 3, partial [Marasmius crinis-equi]